MDKDADRLDDFKACCTEQLSYLFGNVPCPSEVAGMTGTEQLRTFAAINEQLKTGTVQPVRSGKTKDKPVFKVKRYWIPAAIYWQELGVVATIAFCGRVQIRLRLNGLFPTKPLSIRRFETVWRMT